MEYEKWFKRFLEEFKFWPLDHNNWGCFEIEHGKKDIFKNNLEAIRQKVGKKSGIYVYKQADDILYVGKAKSLFGRTKSHNRESFEPVSGDTKDNTWHKFFSAHKGTIHIFWKEVKIENDRAIIEKMLQHFLKPKFDRKIEKKK